MPVSGTIDATYPLLSDDARLAVEPSPKRAPASSISLSLIVVAFIVAVAYADSRVDEISLGYLYLLPLVLSALVNKLLTTFLLIVVCVFLHDLFGPQQTIVLRVALNLTALTGFSVVAIFVNRLARQRRALTEIVRRQRDELAAEIRLAMEVQQQLLPTSTRMPPQIESAGGMTYAKGVGGDYYDFIELPEGDMGVAIADVSGKGVASALLMPAIEVALRLDALGHHAMLETFQSLNKVLYDVTHAARYVTLFYGKLHVRLNQFEYINAGHNPPLWFRQGTKTAEWLDSSSTPLGLLPVAHYATKTVELEKGDIIVLYTDGLTEAENAQGDEFSRERLLQVVSEHTASNAQEIYDVVRARIREFRGTESFDDDLTLIVVKALV